MDLVDTIPDVRYWSKILRCSIPAPHLLTDLEVKVTDLEFFMINEMSISHISQSSESIHLSNIRTLESLLPFHNYWVLTPGYMPWGGAGGKKYRTSSYCSDFELIFFGFKCILVLLARHSQASYAVLGQLLLLWHLNCEILWSQIFCIKHEIFTT